MVTAIPAAGVLRDVFLAVGAGFLLGALYRALRALLGSSRGACFFCDCFVLAAAAVVFRGAAASAFVSGVMRWYTGAALAAAMLWSQRLLRGPSRCVHAALSAPFRAVQRRAHNVVQDTVMKKLSQTERLQKKTRRKDLKKASRVLYNSK